MSALQIKVQSLIEDIKDINNPTDEQRQEAIKLLAATLKYRNAKLCSTRDELADTARKLKDMKEQLDDMNRRLELAKKAGLVSKSVH